VTTDSSRSASVGALSCLGLALVADAVAEGRVARRVGSRRLVAAAGLGLLAAAGLAAVGGRGESGGTETADVDA
jgi:hypothetical protein